MALPVSTRTLLALGYSTTYARNFPDTFPSELTVDELAYVTSLVTKIEAIDTELLENTRDSMAIKVQDLCLDYNRYIAQTLALQGRLRDQLSMTTDIPLHEAESSSYGMSVRNYY